MTDDEGVRNLARCNVLAGTAVTDRASGGPVPLRRRPGRDARDPQTMVTSICRARVALDVRGVRGLQRYHMCVDVDAYPSQWRGCSHSVSGADCCSAAVLPLSP